MSDVWKAREGVLRTKTGLEEDGWMCLKGMVLYFYDFKGQGGDISYTDVLQTVWQRMQDSI